ncbi:hypothetical protein [Sphingobacterium bambusae]|uniref:Uncharacterized protein n=1 Tax=Sphingobacterium bambusae TaxID=662858 RepID=A0ABW6BHX7_9SPHI|nr:hypothetical protein [Sphingobacterium bambusae]WPL49304.1 hypothetical protein SCB77_02390 [Sphingobacterium bambusae]
MDVALPLLALSLFIMIFGFKKLKTIMQSRSWLYRGFILLFIFLFLFGANEFLRRKIGGFAGSYPFVEYWDIQASEKEVIDAITELNKLNPNFQPPKNVEFISKRDTGYIWTSHQMEEYLEKLKMDSLTPLPKKNYNNYYHDYWLHVNLYYPDTKEIVHTWTRPDSNPSVTTFAFVSLSSLDNPNEYRLINRDFWYIANKRQINKFKRAFVDKIQEQIERKRRSSP